MTATIEHIEGTEGGVEPINWKRVFVWSTTIACAIAALSVVISRVVITAAIRSSQNDPNWQYAAYGKVSFWTVHNGTWGQAYTITYESWWPAYAGSVFALLAIASIVWLVVMYFRRRGQRDPGSRLDYGLPIIAFCIASVAVMYYAASVSNLFA